MQSNQETKRKTINTTFTTLKVKKTNKPAGNKNKNNNKVSGLILDWFYKVHAKRTWQNNLLKKFFWYWFDSYESKKQETVQLPYFDQQKHHFHMVQPNTSVIKHTERIGASLVAVQQNSICGESSHK